MNLLTHHPLEELNSFKIPVFASYYIKFNSLKDIEDFCSTIDLTKIKFYILGGGSNTLFIRDFSGYILHVQLPGIEIVQETSDRVLLKVGAGVIWHQLVLFCVERKYGGVENLSLIPGTVGGAVVQNIGAYGVELIDVLNIVEAVELSTRKKLSFEASVCGFGYRTSFFKTKWRNKYLITSITLELHKEEKFTLEYIGIRTMLEKMEVKQLSFKAISDAIIAIRRSKLPDPAALGNVGSFFVNPLISKVHYQQLRRKCGSSFVALSTKNETCIKVSAAWLIEATGFKGLREGNVGVYDLHSLILVNYGGASGRDILNLATKIMQKVKEKFDIILEPEVNIVGQEHGSRPWSHFLSL